MGTLFPKWFMRQILCFGVDSFDTFINQNEIMLDDQMSIAHDLEQQ